MVKEGNPVAAEVEYRKALATKPPREVVPEFARVMLQSAGDKRVVGVWQHQARQPYGRMPTRRPRWWALWRVAAQHGSGQGGARSGPADPGYAPAQLLSARQKAAAGRHRRRNGDRRRRVAKAPADTDALGSSRATCCCSRRSRTRRWRVTRRRLCVDSKYLPAHFAAIAVPAGAAGQGGGRGQATRAVEVVAAKNPQTRSLRDAARLPEERISSARANWPRSRHARTTRRCSWRA